MTIVAYPELIVNSYTPYQKRRQPLPFLPENCIILSLFHMVELGIFNIDMGT